MSDYRLIDIQPGGKEIAFGGTADDNMITYPNGLFKCEMDMQANSIYVGNMLKTKDVDITNKLTGSYAEFSGQITALYFRVVRPEIDAAASSRSSNVWCIGTQFRDVNNQRVGEIGPAMITDGRIGTYYGSSRTVNGTVIYNWLTSYISPTGVRSWGISESKPFLSMLGLTTTTPTGSITTTTGVLKSVTFKRCGNIVTIYLSVRNSSSVASGGNLYAGTLNTTSLRPAMYTEGVGYYGSYGFTVSIGAAGAIVVRNTDTRSFAALSSSDGVSVTVTYIVS